MALDLALHVSLPTTSMSFPYRVFGGQLKEHGTAVILAAEDSYETIHRRFNKIDEALSHSIVLKTEKDRTKAEADQLLNEHRSYTLGKSIKIAQEAGLYGCFLLRF